MRDGIRSGQEMKGQEEDKEENLRPNVVERQRDEDRERGGGKLTAV